MSEIQDMMGIKEEAEAELRKAADRLAIQTKAHIAEQANKKLHTRRGMFIEALSHFQLDDNTWVVQLDASARWIDEGMDEHDMLDSLLKSKKAKKGKDGQNYVVVPFQHNKGAQQLTPAQQTLLATIKKELAKVGTTPNKIETDARGKAKEGLVRTLDINTQPINKRTNPIGRGQLGDVAQGPTGTPLLQGIRVYQRQVKDKKSGEAKMGRFVMTFRVASDKQRNQFPGNSSAPWKKVHPDKPNDQARWHHPGLEAMNLMQEGMEWAKKEWERKVGPDLLDALVASLS